MLAHLLSLLIWMPVLAGILILLAKRFMPPLQIKIAGLVFALLTLALCWSLLVHFNNSSAVLQFNELYPWIKPLGIQYALGVDGLAVLFIVLNCFVGLILILSGWQYVKENAAEAIAVFLFSTGILNGIFASQNAILFYFFWEASMIPVLIGIGLWGGARRAHAAVKFFLFNLLGSLMLLAAIIYLYFQQGSFDLTALQNTTLPVSAEDWIFLAFFAAFAVKMPMWPVHTWFADLQAEAPAGGGMALVALMMKTGAYGFLRFSLPISSSVHQGVLIIAIILALIAIVYAGFAAIVQKNMKQLIAYSSISHMGITTLGIFMAISLVHESTVGVASNQAAAVLGLQGAVFQAISHAFASGGLFILVAILAKRFGSSEIERYQGLAKTMPALAFFFVLFCMANVGLPGTSGFVGEFMVILSALPGNFWVAAVAALTLIVSPAYMLWLVKRVIFGAVSTAQSELIVERKLSHIDWMIMILLSIPVIYFGIFPHAILQLSYASNLQLTDLIARV